MTTGARSTSPHSPTSRAEVGVEIWGGIECTVNRLGDRYYDQVALTGHADRTIADLERFAELGIHTLRYPVLWERIAPHSLEQADWFQTDLALAKMRELGIKPIVGLVHHGSGPHYTSLIDSHFSTKLSEFAGRVADRYPWVDMFTPINEPLTTARFSTLYGHWYPHARDDRSFARAMLNQCGAIRASMEAIRSINPNAKLVQTEDLGKTHSTAALRYQATFDNNRRWLTFDLLSGRLDEWHPLWWYLLESGITRQELESFLTRPCVPDIVGINHYVTSDRYLDERVEAYPAHCRGGNGRHSYVDVEAVRSPEASASGHAGVLREAWDRYALPLALTEVHLGCTRGEQLRWLSQAWHAAKELRRENVDVRAITVWSLLGCYGWSSLLTSDFDSYEPGAFDLRAPQPRATALAKMTRALATQGTCDHPVLDTPGWWKRESRFRYGGRDMCGPEKLDDSLDGARVILVVGANGTLGSAFHRIATERGLATRAVGRAELDICRRQSIASALGEIRPWAVINAAGYVRVDDAETDAERCFEVNSEGAKALAVECARLEIPLATFSSDLVFDGAKPKPYVESDGPCPVNVYGASKARLEDYVKDLPNSLVVRTSAFFGPWDSHNFLAKAFHDLAHGRRVWAANDVVVSPTYVPDLVHTTLDLLIDGEQGIWHVVNDGRLTWYEFARTAAERAGLDTTLIAGRPMNEMGFAALRPSNSSLTSERGKLMPGIDDAVTRWLEAIRSTDKQPEVVEISSSV